MRSFQQKAQTIGTDNDVTSEYVVLDFTGDGTNVWIVGPAGVNCSDGGSFSVSSGTTVNISGLTISHQTGDGLVNGGALNVSSCTFSDNGEPEATYAAIDNSGVLTVTSSTFTGGEANDAGAIYNSGSATVASSTFSDNFAFFIGGAISNVGTMSVQSCTFEGNQTSLYGGAIYNASTGQLSVASCTISGNIATYGGGIYNSSSSSSSIANTIVADNTGFSAGPDIDDTTSTISAAHSLVKLAGSTHGNDVTATDGNVVGVDPDLDSLADNGAATQTMALAADSPILGAGIGADQTAVGAGNHLLFDGMYYYTYDAEGNRTAQYEIASGTDMALGVQSDPNSDAVNITIYTWNNANQMTSATFYATAADWTAGTVNAVGEYQVTYALDAFGRMVTRTAALGNGTSTTTSSENFIYDGQNILLVLDSSGNVIERNLTGPAADEVYATEMVATVTSGTQAAGTVNWLLTDGQGTVRDVVQLDGSSTDEVDHLVYSAFGQLLSQSADATSGDQPIFYYNGTWQDPQTGLNDMGARWYDAVDAVWASYDPIGFDGGQTNLSEYCGNSPTNFVDPSGLQANSNWPVYEGSWQNGTYTDKNSSGQATGWYYQNGKWYTKNVYDNPPTKLANPQPRPPRPDRGPLNLGPPIEGPPITFPGTPTRDQNTAKILQMLYNDYKEFNPGGGFKQDQKGKWHWEFKLQIPVPLNRPIGLLFDDGNTGVPAIPVYLSGPWPCPPPDDGTDPSESADSASEEGGT